MAESTKSPYILGLDLGVQSVGWAVIDLDDEGQPCGIRRAGVRCFDSGVGSETEIAMGKDESANTGRRQARLQRRQLWRRGRRLKKVFHVLQDAGLLPPDKTSSPEDRHELLKKLDAELVECYIPDGDRIAAHLLPYRLRAMALDSPLTAFAFGRTLFHLAQRRGFLSNRKTAAKEGDDELGKVKAGISELSKLMEQSGARTLGEYFSRLDPEEQRIRKRWTARQMYLDEFERIWAAQAPHHSQLTAELKNRIHNAIFHQRPLKPQDSLVGICELEPSCRRAPRAAIEAQRFRYLQKVNDLEISTPDGQLWRLDDPQHADLRAKLVAILENQAEVEFKSLRSKLGLKKPKGGDADFQFNLEAGGEKKIKGNTTASRLRRVLGDDFEKLSPECLRGMIEDLLAYEKKEALASRLAARYGIPPAKADALSDETFKLEDGYASLSREAMRKLLPLMEQGVRFATAKKMVYDEFAGRDAPCDFLPPVLTAMPQLRNPVVCRGLTELRKVVNAIVREYGKPATVRVELARDLKRSRDQREKLTKQNRDNEKSREAARRKIAERMGCNAEDVSDFDVLKVRLAEECNWECPYTGKTIAMEALVGRQSQFDVEHIIPFSRSLDNSFQNKTLCDAAENRNVKQNRTPLETYSGDENRWHEILGRVKRFRSSAGHAKLRKFQQLEPDADFAARMLQDTRYMSTLAAGYLGLLYGGQIDAAGRRRVQVSAGRMTAYLRGEWGLNAILADGEEDEKNRGDHRHHAVDAVAIALTDASTVKLLSTAAEMAEQLGRRLFVPVDAPWPTFLEDTHQAIEAINISFRVNRRVSGRLHEDTFYSPPKSKGDHPSDGVSYYHVRKPLDKMTAGMIELIVDDSVRKAVQDKLAQLGGFRVGVFAHEADHPYLRTRNDRLVMIHKARIRLKKSVLIPVGKTGAVRRAEAGRNHHMEIYSQVGRDGQKEWVPVAVNLFEAYKRVRDGANVVYRNHGPGTEFVFSLAINEHVQMDGGDDGSRHLFRVASIWQERVEFRLHNDARVTIVKRITRSPEQLRKAKARKVVVDPLGNILPAND